mmetsp:Transcript_1225/g.2937  ORF Transcript_1225/g.2937 Transcript_1225/m.2937 type:complete len:109 (-) Transcript_1225:437-763(-)
MPGESSRLLGLRWTRKWYILFLGIVQQLAHVLCWTLLLSCKIFAFFCGVKLFSGGQSIHMPLHAHDSCGLQVNRMLIVGRESIEEVKKKFLAKRQQIIDEESEQTPEH